MVRILPTDTTENQSILPSTEIDCWLLKKIRSGKLPNSLYLFIFSDIQITIKNEYFIGNNIFCHGFIGLWRREESRYHGDVQESTFTW
jgi:hypothetical protein